MTIPPARQKKDIKSYMLDLHTINSSSRGIFFLVCIFKSFKNLVAEKV